MKFFLLTVHLFVCGIVIAQPIFNGNLEVMDSVHQPLGWNLAFNKNSGYEIKTDSVVKRQGEYSISIASKNGKGAYDAISFAIPRSYNGKMLTLIGSIKTENVTDGYAGLWVRLDGQEGQIIAFDNMKSHGVSGTTDWQEYMIELPYGDEDVSTINFGALLAGKGKMWVDSIQLYFDEVPIDKATTLFPKYDKESDTIFSKSSGVGSIDLTQTKIKYLALLGELWGFLKYYHPAVAKGLYNWDTQLLKILPAVLNCQTKTQLSQVLERWVDQVSKPDSCIACVPIPPIKNVAIKPDYGSLFTNTTFSKRLTAKLQYILNNGSSHFNYYVRLADGTGNPIFRHEPAYLKMEYPDAGYRLLALYRYWNMVQYFFPNRALITEGWNGLLPKYIPQFVRAKNKTDYLKSVVTMIASIHDTHAFISSTSFEEFKGKYRLPLQAKFIENKLVITGYYGDTMDVKKMFQVGDVITTINGIAINVLMKKYLPLTPASNYDAKLRDLPGTYLLRSNRHVLEIKLLRHHSSLTLSYNGVESSKLDTYDYNRSPHVSAPGYKLIKNDIGYLFSGLYKNENLEDTKQKFKNTKGIIIDMRGYPSDEMGFTLGNYLKSFSSPFVTFTKGSVSHPGAFLLTPPQENGTIDGDHYKGKVIVIVNSQTQSNAEYTTMAFQSDSRVIVIGSKTSGADGNISTILLPGGITTNFSGLGVYYPDGANAQRKGVKINYVVRPTLKGIKEGRDELLEKAIRLINQN